jgi:telomerase reverse transcriptase
MIIDIESGEVRIDYSRFRGGRGGDVLTVDHVRQPGRNLSIAMKTFVRPRCVPILFDSFINSPATQLANFYQLLVLAAVKSAEYIRSSCIVAGISSNLPFLEASVSSTISYSYTLVLGRCRDNSSSTSSGFERPVAFWLGWKAFADVFCKFPELQPLTTVLRAKLDRVSVSTRVRVVAADARKGVQIDRLF